LKTKIARNGICNYRDRHAIISGLVTKVIFRRIDAHLVVGS
jgi:hypothetical protein